MVRAISLHDKYAAGSLPPQLRKHRADERWPYPH